MFYIKDFDRILPLFGEYAGVCILITFILAVFLIPQPKEAIKHSTPLNSFYFLKILLTLGIVLHHIFNYLGIWNKADFCVEFFFIISGFMVCYTYNPSKTTKNFTMSKLFIFVPYILFANLLSLFGKGNIDLLRFVSGICLFSTTPFYPHHTYYMPAWYLVILFWVGLLYFIMTRITKNAIWGIMGITFISLVTLYYQSAPIESYNVLIPWLNNGMIRGLACMGLGYCLASIYLHHKTFFAWNKLILCPFLIGLLVYIPLTLFRPSYSMDLGWEILYFLMLCFLFLCTQSGIFNNPLWGKLAKFMLPIFMTHDVIVPVLIYGSNILTPLTLTTKVFILLLASVLSGIFTYYMFYVAQLCHQRIFKQKKVRL